MDLCKTYSHIRSYTSNKSKQKTTNKSREKSVARKRSVTFNSDIDLVKSISCQENLLDLIGRVQKQKLDYLLSLQSSAITILPSIKKEQNEKKQQQKKRLFKDNSDLNYLLDQNKKMYLKQNNQNSYIEPIQVKKIDYQYIQTFESALAQYEFQELHKGLAQKKQEEEKLKFIEQSESQLQIGQNIIDEENQKFKEQMLQNYNQEYDLFQEQSKMNKIINEALKFKQIKRDPINASKSVKQQRTLMSNYLNNQYKNALNQVMQGIDINKDCDDKFIRKKQYSKRKKLNQSLNNSKITTEYTKKAIFSQYLHPQKQEILNKTIEIYDKCNNYLQ